MERLYWPACILCGFAIFRSAFGLAMIVYSRDPLHTIEGKREHSMRFVKLLYDVFVVIFAGAVVVWLSR